MKIRGKGGDEERKETRKQQLLLSCIFLSLSLVLAGFDRRRGEEMVRGFW